MIVYGDTKVYHNSVRTLVFLKKLRSASAMDFALQLGSQATGRYHFFTVAQLNIDIPISGLISIFMKSGCAGFSLSGSHILTIGHYITFSSYNVAWVSRISRSHPLTRKNPSGEPSQFSWASTFL